MSDKDAIYRQDAIDALCDNCDNVQAVCPHYPCKQYTAIEALPTAQPGPCEDFVKVVRCKKCRYVHCDKEFDNYWCNRMSGTFMVEAEGFCKWGR